MKKDTLPPVNTKIKSWREERSLTLWQAAGIIGIPASLVWMLESGDRRFTINTASKYIAADPDVFRPEDFFVKVGKGGVDAA